MFCHILYVDDFLYFNLFPTSFCMHKLFVLYKLKLFTFLNFTLFISEKNIVNLKHNFGIEGSQV